MYKVGDYVVDKKSELILHTINVLEIVEVSDKAAMCKYVVPPKETIPFNSEGKVFLNIEQLRPAVLSDWAKEIPEKYRNECADDEQYIWLISYPNNEVGIVLSANNNSNQGYLVDEKWFIADALSAHYGIPILPYEQYKEYMKAQI